MKVNYFSQALTEWGSFIGDTLAWKVQRAFRRVKVFLAEGEFPLSLSDPDCSQFTINCVAFHGLIKKGQIPHTQEKKLFSPFYCFDNLPDLEKAPFFYYFEKHFDRELFLQDLRVHIIFASSGLSRSIEDLRNLITFYNAFVNIDLKTTVSPLIDEYIQTIESDRVLNQEILDFVDKVVNVVEGVTPAKTNGKNRTALALAALTAAAVGTFWALHSSGDAQTLGYS